MPDPANATATTDHPEPPEAFRASASRRNVLRSAGLVAVVGAGGLAFASCSSSSTATPATSTPPSSSSSGATSSSAGGPSVTKAQVPEGGGYIMPDAAFVVTQPEKGTYKAFSKICTHQGCPVSQIVNKEIVCNCHGSHYSITDGSVISGPAPRPLPESKATVSGDNIVIAA